MIEMNKYHFGTFLIFFYLEGKEETGTIMQSLSYTHPILLKTSVYSTDSFPFILPYIFNAVLYNSRAS